MSHSRLQAQLDAYIVGAAGEGSRRLTRRWLLCVLHVGATGVGCTKSTRAYHALE